MTKSTELNYLELSQQLEKILSELQAEQTSIDQSIKLYENAQIIIAKMKKYLENTELEVKKIKIND